LRTVENKSPQIDEIRKIVLTSLLVGVLVGPWYGAVGALIAGIIRNAMGTGTLFAFLGAKDEVAMRKNMPAGITAKARTAGEMLEDGSPRVLFVNDVSLFLHTGSVDGLVVSSRRIPAVIMNGY
jgi:hypothetical protein